ncbi:MAG: hypothetical protein OQL28_06330, partial [Sedimenticola sp.]|nr:hypothetical protein [Sedimenticola sp.]
MKLIGCGRIRWLLMAFLLPPPLLAGSPCDPPTPYQQGADVSRAWHPAEGERCFRPGPGVQGNRAAKRYGEIFELLGKGQAYFQPLLEQARNSDTRFCLEDRADGSRGYYDYRFNL